MSGYGRIKACLVLDVSLLNAWTALIDGKLGLNGADSTMILCLTTLVVL
jgi:hypothetical protein